MTEQLPPIDSFDSLESINRLLTFRAGKAQTKPSEQTQETTDKVGEQASTIKNSWYVTKDKGGMYTVKEVDRKSSERIKLSDISDGIFKASNSSRELGVREEDLTAAKTLLKYLKASITSRDQYLRYKKLPAQRAIIEFGEKFKNLFTRREWVTELQLAGRAHQQLLSISEQTVTHVSSHAHGIYSRPLTNLSESESRLNPSLLPIPAGKQRIQDARTAFLDKTSNKTFENRLKDYFTAVDDQLWGENTSWEDRSTILSVVNELADTDKKKFIEKFESELNKSTAPLFTKNSVIVVFNTVTK